MDVEWSAMGSNPQSQSLKQATRNSTIGRCYFLLTVKKQMKQLNYRIQYVSNMYQTCIKTAIYLYIPYKRNLQWLATARCLPLGKQSQNTHFQFSSPRKAWVLESSHHISTSRCLPGGSVVRWKHAKNVWKPMEKSVWKLVCLRSCRYSPDLQTSGSTGSRIVHWGSHHILSLAIKQLKSCNAQLWILQRRSHSMVTFKHISSPIYISTYFSWWPACLTIWIFEVIPPCAPLCLLWWK